MKKAKKKYILRISEIIPSTGIMVNTWQLRESLQQYFSIICSFSAKGILACIAVYLKKKHKKKLLVSADFKKSFKCCRIRAINLKIAGYNLSPELSINSHGKMEYFNKGKSFFFFKSGAKGKKKGDRIYLMINSQHLPVFSTQFKSLNSFSCSILYSLSLLTYSI